MAHLFVNILGAFCLIHLLLAWIGVSASTNNIVVDTHWDRFRIQDVCSNENRNLRLYLDYNDRGWVRGYPAEAEVADSLPNVLSAGVGFYSSGHTNQSQFGNCSCFSMTTYRNR